VFLRESGPRSNGTEGGNVCEADRPSPEWAAVSVWWGETWVGVATPNVRAKPTAEAGAVSPDRDDSTNGAVRAYSACRSGSA
jgi:hypothetical protein